MRSRTAAIATAVMVVLAGSGGGCLRLAPDIDSADPAVRIPAMQQAVDRPAADPEVLERLVDGLSSDDAAVRFYSIESLRRMTGETFDYRYYDAPEASAAAVDRWRAWLQDQAGAASADLSSR